MYVCACIRTCVYACEYVIHIIMIVLPVLHCHLDSYVLPGVDEGSQFVNKNYFSTVKIESYGGLLRCEGL